MHARFVRFSVLAVAAVALAACGAKIVFNKAVYDTVKKVAVVEYRLNPSVIIGAGNTPELQVQVADANLKQVFEKLTGMGYDLTTLDELKANAAYQAMTDKVEGFVAPAGLRFVAEYKQWDYSALPAPTAAKLCEALGVDAVVVVNEHWAVGRAVGYGPFAKATIGSRLFVQMFDKGGQQVWADNAAELSSEGIAMIGGVLTSGEGLVLNATQSVGASLDVMRERLAAARSGK